MQPKLAILGKIFCNGIIIAQVLRNVQYNISRKGFIKCFDPGVSVYLGTTGYESCSA